MIHEKGVGPDTDQLFGIGLGFRRPGLRFGLPEELRHG